MPQNSQLCPLKRFSIWLDAARISELNDPEAVALATANAQGQPAVRMVLLKGHGEDGFIFYTNQQSRKADDLGDNPQAALLFHWKSLRRQIRIEGSVAPVDPQLADRYFASRSRASQLGAWASDQSRKLEHREMFEARYNQLQQQYAGKDIPRPPHWSGYRLTPVRIEFWRDGAHRLHHREIFERSDVDNQWQKYLLYP